MMASEFNTVLWKEWKEIVMERSGGAGSFSAAHPDRSARDLCAFSDAPGTILQPVPVADLCVFRRGRRHRRDCRFIRRRAGTPYPRNTARNPPFGPCDSLWKDRRIASLMAG